MQRVGLRDRVAGYDHGALGFRKQLCRRGNGTRVTSDGRCNPRRFAEIEFASRQQNVARQRQKHGIGWWSERSLRSAMDRPWQIGQLADLGDHFTNGRAIIGETAHTSGSVRLNPCPCCPAVTRTSEPAFCAS